MTTVYERLVQSVDQRDIDLYQSLLHADYRFIRHQSNSEMNRTQMVEMVNMMFNAEGINFLSRRCIYENSDILVEHTVMDFPDSTRESIISVHQLKDGQIIRTETGATLIKTDD